jgi:hypothetical protein
LILRLLLTEESTRISSFLCFFFFVGCKTLTF